MPQIGQILVSIFSINRSYDKPKPQMPQIGNIFVNIFSINRSYDKPKPQMPQIGNIFVNIFSIYRWSSNKDIFLQIKYISTYIPFYFSRTLLLNNLARHICTICGWSLQSFNINSSIFVNIFEYIINLSFSIYITSIRSTSYKLYQLY